jgi:choline dehydrogenase
MLTGLFPRKFWVNNARLNPEGIIPPSLLEDDAQGFVMLSILLHPYSRGSVTLSSASPSSPPRISPNYLLDERDLNTLATGAIECVKIVERMGFSSDHVVRNPTRFSKGLYDIDGWKEQCRQACATLYHPSSTCAMGLVVDSNLNVKGIEGLKVADASVFPHLTSGNTNAPCIMVGEMAADILKKQYKLI